MRPDHDPQRLKPVPRSARRCLLRRARKLKRQWFGWQKQIDGALLGRFKRRLALFSARFTLYFSRRLLLLLFFLSQISVYACHVTQSEEQNY